MACMVQAKTATLCTACCNPMQGRLQPYAPEAATLCKGGYNHLYRRLQPCTKEAATLCNGGCNLKRPHLIFEESEAAAASVILHGHTVGTLTGGGGEWWWRYY